MTRVVVPKVLRAPIVGPYSDVPARLTREQCFIICEKIAGGASVRAAAHEAGASFIQYARELVANEEFAADIELAKKLRVDALEEIALEQATVGIDEVLTHQGHISINERGEPVTVKKLVTNNGLLLALLKANNREKFTERSEVITRTDDDVPTRITSESDREKILAALRARAAKSLPAPDPDEDLL